jgi:hypothetical protein
MTWGYMGERVPCVEEKYHGIVKTSSTQHESTATMRQVKHNLVHQQGTSIDRIMVVVN